MHKVILTIEGMQCGMCESHVCDTLRKVCGAKDKVTASHTTGQAEIIMDDVPDVARLKGAIKATGYKVLDVKVEDYEKKKKFFGLF